MTSIILIITIILVGIYACVIVDKSKNECHKKGCKKCGRCHRMREDAEK